MGGRACDGAGGGAARALLMLLLTLLLLLLLLPLIVGLLPERQRGVAGGIRVWALGRCRRVPELQQAFWKTTAGGRL